MYTDNISGEYIKTCNFNYRKISMSQDTNLLWPYQTKYLEESIAKVMIVYPESNNLNLNLPDPSLYENGFYLLIINNHETNNLKVKSSTNLMSTVQPGHVIFLMVNNNENNIGSWTSIEQNDFTSLSLNSLSNGLIINSSSVGKNLLFQFSFSGILNQFSFQDFNVVNEYEGIGFYYINPLDSKKINIGSLFNSMGFNNNITISNVQNNLFLSSSSSSFFNEMNIVGDYSLQISEETGNINISSTSGQVILSHEEESENKLGVYLLKRSNISFKNEDKFVSMNSSLNMVDRLLQIIFPENLGDNLDENKNYLMSYTIGPQEATVNLYLSELKSEISESDMYDATANDCIARPCFMNFSKSLLSGYILFSGISQDGSIEVIDSFYTTIFEEERYSPVSKIEVERKGVGFYAVSVSGSYSTDYIIECNASDNLSPIVTNVEIDAQGNFMIKCYNKATQQYQDCEDVFFSISTI